MVTVTTNHSPKLNALQKVLAYLATGISILAALSFVIVVIGILSGVSRDDLATGFWSSLMLCTWLGFTAAIALIIGYIVTTAMKNARANRKGDN